MASKDAITTTRSTTDTQQPNRALEAERAAVANMSYEEEMLHWERQILAEGEKEKGRGGQWGR